MGQVFAVLLAAVVHDVNHPGRNNAFQINARTRLALVYNDQSVLENHHVSHAFKRMLGLGTELSENGLRHNDLNPLLHASPKLFLSIRTKIIEAVMRTDMSKHFESIDMIQNLVSARKEQFNEEDSWTILQYMLHVADISNAAKVQSLSTAWTDRCLDEFFAQGDVEADMGLPISPNCDRNTTDKPDCQIGFIEFIILPSYELLGSLIPQVKKQIIPNIEENLEYWKRQRNTALSFDPNMNDPDETVSFHDETRSFQEESFHQKNRSIHVDSDTSSDGPRAP